MGEVDAPDINAWFAYMRKTPGSRGKPRSERTIQTYARSARAFFHWLVRRETIERSPFDRVVFPKVGKPLIRTIEPEEFERLLLACTPPGEVGPFVDRAAARNRAILWVLYDTGIRLSELCGLRLRDFDRKHGLLTVLGKGSKERRIALGNNCLRNLLYYLERHRPDEEELAEWGSAGEDHLFLSETRLPLTKNGVILLFKRIRKRAGITDKRISRTYLPPFLRHSLPGAGQRSLQSPGTVGARGYDDRQELHAHERRDHPVPEAQVQPRRSPADAHAGTQRNATTGLSGQGARSEET